MMQQNQLPISILIDLCTDVDCDLSEAQESLLKSRAYIRKVKGKFVATKKMKQVYESLRARPFNIKE